MTLTTRKMSIRHEQDVADRLGGRLTRGSGSTWVDQTDGKHSTQEGRAYPFSWDCKSTLGKSMSISRATIAKLREQTAAGLFPLLPIRFYRDERLTMVDEDLVVLDLELFEDILADAELGARARRELGW